MLTRDVAREGSKGIRTHLEIAPFTLEESDPPSKNFWLHPSCCLRKLLFYDYSADKILKLMKLHWIIEEHPYKLKNLEILCIILKFKVQMLKIFRKGWLLKSFTYDIHKNEIFRPPPPFVIKLSQISKIFRDFHKSLDPPKYWTS